ncbi:putative ribonuclease [Trypanosoma theileri]|uniref:Putative ribonuclease n=1 Tax=Trypanosoma theileri TaxID=67003 RepID=A0A1X0NXI3_9TRYP|nr:putative ribonuclease [Trypanosoma theileri]ORC89248.1 putative ribonuclease [Trypanosoma theileri]
MQVTRDNFPAIFPKFVELLQTCDFYSFDEEMTGINTPELPESMTDSPEESYRAKCTVASRYNIIQVGICLFHKDNKNSKSTPTQYIARPFNFILFPNHSDDFTIEERSRDVVLSPSSLAFLRRHDMNFQSWIYYGIAYCDKVQEEALRKKHQERYKELSQNNNNNNNNNNNKDQGIDIMTEEEKKWFDNAVSTVRTFSDRIQDTLNRVKEKNKDFPLSKIELAATMDLLQSSGREIFLTPVKSKTVREYFKQYVEKHFNNVLISFRRQGSSFTGIVRAIFPEERARLEKKEENFKKRELTDMLGFRLIFKALVESEKPCVGHNCFADILFLFASLESSLPDTLPEFKERLGKMFPIIFDTRYIASRQDYFPLGRFGSRYLGGFFEEYGFNSANIQVKLPLGFEAYDAMTTEKGERNSSSSGSSSGNNNKNNNGLTHEAGYDALLTGTLLLNLLAEMGGYDVATAPKNVINRVALFRSLYALRLDDLKEDEYLPENGVLELRHEKNIKVHHIESCFLTLSFQNVSLYTIDETRTLAVLPSSWSKSPTLVGENKDAKWLSTFITSRFPQYFEASLYDPARNKPGMGVGPFRTTPKALMRAALKAALR